MTTKSELKNQKYWQDRSLQLEQALNKIGEDFYKDLARQYDQAAINIQKEIEAFYARFAAHNKLSFADAQRILTGPEKKAYQMSVEDYIAKGRTLPFSDQYKEQLENASTAYRVTRLQALQLEMRKEVDSLMSRYDTGMKKTASTIYTEGYYRNLFNLQQGTGVGLKFDKLNKKKVAAAVSKPWTADDKTFSSRIWGDKRASLVSYLETDVARQFARGESIDKITKGVVEKFGASKSDAYRLVQTESSYFASASTKDAYEQQGLERYEIVATLDSRTSEICRDMDGEDFAVSEYRVAVTAPPFHARCRTTTAPFFEWDEIDEQFGFGERIARGADGRNYSVPADMTYKHWYSKYVEPDVLTKYDKEVILRYLGGEAYTLNEKLRDKATLNSDERDWVDRLDLALEKTQDYSGDISRSVHFHAQEDLQKFLKEHTIGNIVKYPAYTSFTGGGTYNPDANVQIFVKSKTGKDITSLNAKELEVLYKRDSRFKVILISRFDNVYEIVLEEI